MKKQQHQLTPIALAVAMAVLSLAPSAQAQQADAAEPAAKGQEKEEVVKVVVSGIRAGIESAISSKRTSSSIIEAISAEDIGKLPDVSIAESIARLPGLAAQRVAGSAQVISLRGLAPDFATTLLNGREQVSTGDNRGVEFDQYPSELISRVLVYKTPDASLVGQGLSGTLALETLRPLAFGKRQVALNGRYEHKSLNNLGGTAKAHGNRLSAAYIDQFAERTIGVAVGYAHLESPIAAEEFGTYGWSTSPRPGVPAGVQNTAGLKTFARSGMNTRDGVIGVLEWRPNRQWHMLLDAYYSKFHREETDRGIETRLDQNSGNTPTLAFTSATVVDNALLKGTAANVYPAVRNVYNDRTDTLKAAGWNTQYKDTLWTFVSDLSYSSAERHETNFETQASQRTLGNKAILDTVSYDLTGNSFPSVNYGLNYADPATVMIGPTIFRAGYGKLPAVKDRMHSLRLIARRSLEGIFDNVEFGVNFANRDKSKTQPEARITELNVGSFLPVADAALLPATDLGFSGVPGSLSWNVPLLVGMGTNFQPFAPVDNTNSLIQKRWNVSEKLTTTYLQFNLDTRLASIPVRGNVGVQVQTADQSSTSDIFDNSSATNKVKPFTDGARYTDVLPSMNLVFELPSQQVLRLGAAKQVARPRLDQLKSAFEFSINGTNGVPTGRGGNPRLDPWRADAIDVSYEKYFDKKGYVSVAAFKKNIKSYIFDLKRLDYDFSAFTNGNPLATTNIGEFSQPLNGTGGSLQGVELTMSLPLSMLTPHLNGFGLIASRSRNSSSITIDNTNIGNKVDLPGLSRDTSNLTVYYEKGGFSTRVSRRGRSDFVGEITGFGADRALRFVSGEAIVDAQVSYTFKDGPLAGLGVLLQVNNLTDSGYRTYRQTHAQIEEFQRYGRTFLIGANYRF
ncbi:MAG: TonB-dependent receptor [Sideroxyarcus sp.]|nr:TonB-dependent receptor [Sideroxyarcus sp.]